MQKIINILKTIFITFFSYNILTYLMLLNKEQFEYYIFQASNNKHESIIKMFDNIWTFSFYANFIILGVGILIFILKIIDDKKGVK